MNHTTYQPYPDVPLHVSEAGQGPAALVLHGGGGPASVQSIIDRLAQNHRVVAPTHPGWDETPRPEWFDGVDDLVETYLDLIEDLDLKDVLVVGSSFGGWLASEIAIRDRGHRLSSLILIDAIGPNIAGHQINFRPSGPLPTRTAVDAGPPIIPAAANIAALQAYTGPTLADPKLFHRLSRINVPTLVLWGENDVVVTPAFGDAYAAAIPDAHFVLVPGAGHIPTREEPAATFAAIDSFLNAVPAE